MKTIVLIGAGKSASCLIEFLETKCDQQEWRFYVADSNKDVVQSKLSSDRSIAVQLDIQQADARKKLIEKADVVISMMPPHLHSLVAEDCLELRKHLLTASYTDDKMRSMAEEIRENNLLFLCEMGLDPGIDHMSAMKIIDSVQQQGGVITSFKSHCGGLVAPESDNNPWHYKISWNPRNIVMAGKSGAVYLENGETISNKYAELFDASNTVPVSNLGLLGWYPNRDSLSYLSLYKLETVSSFIRTTLRYPSFNKGWKQVIDWHLTDESTLYDSNSTTVANFVTQHLTNHQLLADYNEKTAPNALDIELRELFLYLDLMNNHSLPSKGKMSALDYLQYVLETKWKLDQNDKDMIVMLHEFEYTLDDQQYKLSSSLVVKGKDPVRTAMAKTVGLPLGIAAVMLLQRQLEVTGLHIPTLPEIYLPVLESLEKEGIYFEETIERVN